MNKGMKLVFIFLLINNPKLFCRFKLIYYFISMVKAWLFFLMFCTAGTLLYGQYEVNSGSQDIVNNQINRLIQVHDSVFDPGKDLLNGRLYYPSGNKFIHPFFLDNTWKTAKIWIADRVYDEEMIKYDINSDYLIHMFFWDLYTIPVSLNRETVHEFIISGHRFRYLYDFDRSSEVMFKPGYYEVLYDGITKFYARWEKSKDDISDPSYSEKIFFVLEKGGKKYLVKSKRGLMHAFQDHKKEIKTFMSRNNIRFSLNYYYSIEKVFQYYDNL